MGNATYCSTSRAERSATLGYETRDVSEIFVQSSVGAAHESMDPSLSKIRLRESRDSETHPNTVPIQLWLDVTASMGMVPEHLVRKGLPKMMTKLIDAGVKDAALLFGAIGDHEVDYHPLQVGQFESGDEELDMWLTRTFIEKGGGINRGESYGLAWQFSAHHVETDAWDKRNKKGYLFTVGDEPPLLKYPASALTEIYGEDYQSQTFSLEDLLVKAQEKFNVYHIHVNHSPHRAAAGQEWKEILGQRCLICQSADEVPELIISAVVAGEQFGGDVTPLDTPKEIEIEEVIPL